MEIIDRAKTVAKEKKEEIAAGIEEEKEYQRFKHPTVGYLKTGKRTTNYDQSEKFAKRFDAEKVKAKEKAMKRAETRTAIKSFAKEKIKTMKSEAKKQPKKKIKSDPIFGMGATKGADPIGFGGGSGFDLGFGKKKGKKEFSIW